MHPLTILAVGLYGETLPNQNGAPLRLVVPWKYGFKSIKSIVRIRLVEKQPPTSWNMQSPSEYGFYSNVNPQVDHPRWSQETERRIGEAAACSPSAPTLPFNGYADQVASLYTGMDLADLFLATRSGEPYSAHYPSPCPSPTWERGCPHRKPVREGVPSPCGRGRVRVMRPG